MTFGDQGQGTQTGLREPVRPFTIMSKALNKNKGFRSGHSAPCSLTPPGLSLNSFLNLFPKGPPPSPLQTRTCFLTLHEKKNCHQSSWVCELLILKPKRGVFNRDLQVRQFRFWSRTKNILDLHQPKLCMVMECL